jgi:acetyl-CoA C-acetyltransferase
VATEVHIVGAGWSGFAPTTPQVSYKELMFEAASMAYADARIDPRRDIDSFVCCSEDLDEGTSIFDEYVPDQLGAVQRPVQTVAGDGLFGLATAAMLIRSGVAGVVAVEAHSKASNVVSQGRIDRFALDPMLNRPIGVPPMALAAFEMRLLLDELGGGGPDACDDVVHRNREHAAAGARGDANARPLDPPERWFDPLAAHHVAPSADGCVVLVCAGADRAPAGGVVVDAVDWRQDAPSIESRRWGWVSGSLEQAVERAFARSSIEVADVDLAEVDDRYAHRQVATERLLASAGCSLDADRVQPSGGALGEGYLHEAHGLARALACFERIRAGDSKVALASITRDVPSTASCVAILRGDAR